MYETVSARRKYGLRNNGSRLMLDLNTDTVRFIIDKSRQFQSRESMSGAEEPSSPDDDERQRTPTDQLDDDSYGELVSTINDLEPDQQVSLVALMWLGRGDYTLDEWDDALAEAADAYNARSADYLIATPLLSDYLEEALAMHGYSDD
jgi:Protein of unknown function (DUF3775)